MPNTTSAFQALIHNITLLLAIAVLFDLAKLNPRKAPHRLQQILFGFGLGIVGIFIMLTPWEFAPGIVFDTRSILLGISGLFFGPIPTVITMFMTATFRLYQGGMAAWTGISVILVTGTLGIAWRHYRAKAPSDISLKELYTFALTSHIIMLALMFTLPRQTALSVLSSITLPILILYPVGAVLVGSLMRSRMRRERNEDLIRESEERYRLLADNISDVLWILNLETGRWEYMSPSVERLRGYTAEEVMAQSVTEVMTPASYIEVQRSMQERIAAVSSKDDLGQPQISRIEQTCKDGSTVWTEVATRYARNKDGQLTLLGNSRNITERIKAEEALRASEDNFRRLVEEAPIPIHVQTEGLFSYVNPACACLLGAETATELLGRPVALHFHPDDQATLIERIKPIDESGEEQRTTELRILRKDGTTIDVEAYAAPFVRYGETGSLVFMLDISGRKEAEKTALALALERQHVSMLTSFVEDVSHEFRTPLSVIQADLYLLERQADQEERRQKVAEIKQQFLGLTRLIDVLSTTIQIYSEESNRREVVDLNDQIHQTIDALAGKIQIDGPSLSWDRPPELLLISANSSRLHIALSEILSNALRFTPPDGYVRVCTGKDANGAIVEIKDNGPGMPADVLPHIFERFYRQDIAHTTPGLGLGLSMAQTIINEHGGRIEVESEPGKGSLFRVVLPIAGHVEWNADGAD